MAAHLLEASADDIEFEAGHFRVRGTDRSITMVDTAKAFYAPFLPPGVTLGLQATASFDGMIPSYPNGCHVCEVELDPDTGEIRIDRHVVVDDCGRPINPMICEGQIQGGIAQGIGQALMENVVYDRDSGQLLSGSYMDYAMPRASGHGRAQHGVLQRAVHHQSAWHQGRGRIRHHRRAARGDECRRRRAAQRRRRSHRHAGDASARMAGAGGAGLTLVTAGEASLRMSIANPPRGSSHSISWTWMIAICIVSSDRGLPPPIQDIRGARRMLAEIICSVPVRCRDRGLETELRPLRSKDPRVPSRLCLNSLGPRHA